MVTVNDTAETANCTHIWTETPDGWQCKACGVLSHEVTEIVETGEVEQWTENK